MILTHRPVVVRGAGDLATGAIQKLVHAGLSVYALETAEPTAIRRHVALSEAVYDGVAHVEDITAVRADDLREAKQALDDGRVPILVDPQMSLVSTIKPIAVIDATLAKVNAGLSRHVAPITIALGPGFTAGVDCDIVIETLRGHTLGRLITSGQATSNTGVPGLLGGQSHARVLRAPCAGVHHGLVAIGDSVAFGDTVLCVDDVPLTAPFPGVVRGLLRDGLRVHEGDKLCDIDPRSEARAYCDTISDKARALGGAVLEALLLRLRPLQGV